MGGLEKPHASGSKVRKVCTMTTAATASGGTTISVLNANMFTAGDDIYIERASEADGTTDHVGYWSSNFQEMKHTISSVSGNNITLTSSLGYTVKNNVRVTRLSRNILFECLTPATDFAHLYVSIQVIGIEHVLLKMRTLETEMEH